VERTNLNSADAITHVINAIHRSEDIIDILAVACEQIHRSISCDFVNILFHHATSKYFYLMRSLTSQNSTSDDQIIIPYHETSITDIIRSHRCMIRADLTQRGLLTPGDLKFMAEGTKSDLSVPIIRKNQVLAILHLSSYQSHFFTEEHQRQAEQFAALLAIALERTDLAEKLSRQQADLTLWKNKFNRLVEHIDQPVAIIRAGDDLICDCNQAFQQLTGLSAEQLNGRRLSSLHPQHQDILLSKLDKSLLREKPLELGVVPLMRNDGSQIPVKIRLVEVGGPQHLFVYAIYTPHVVKGAMATKFDAATTDNFQLNHAHFDALVELTKLSNQELSLERLVQSVLLIVKRIADFDFAQICFFDSDQSMIETHTIISDTCRQFEKQHDWMIVEDCEFYWYNVARSPLTRPGDASGPANQIEARLRSRIAAVLGKAHRYEGMLLLGSLKENQYQRDQVQLIHHLADIITWIIDHARSVAEYQQMKLCQQAKSELNHVIQQDFRIEQLLHGLARINAKWLNAKLTTIHFTEPLSGIPDIVVTDDQCNPMAIARFEKREILPALMNSSELYVLKTISSQELEKLDCSISNSIANLISYLAIPLKWKGKTIGVATNYFARPFHMTTIAAKQIIALTELAHDVIQQIQFHQQIMQRLDYLERAIEWSTDTIDNFANDLRAPLASIQALATAGIKNIEPTQDSELFNYLQKIKIRSHHLQIYIDALAKFADFDLTTSPRIPVDSRRLVELVIQQFHDIFQQRNIKFQMDKNMPSILADRQLMFHLFAQLVSSSIEQLTGDSVRPKIEIGYQLKRNEGLFVIRNNGPAIQNGQLQHLFEAPDLGEDQPDNGVHQRMNLAIARKIVELYNGQIWFESSATKGNRFYLRLPVQNNDEFLCRSKQVQTGIENLENCNHEEPGNRY